VRRGDSASLLVQVRGSGVVGRVRQGNEPSTFSRAVEITKVVGAVLVGFLLMILLSIKFGEFRLFLQRGFSRQIRALETRSPGPSLSDDQMKQLLLSKTFRFHYNPSVSLDRFKLMRFGADGAILEGGNKNATTWRVKNGLFEFINTNKEINSRFYYSPSDQIFYQMPDPDTAAVARMGIGDQYMLPVAQVASAN